MLYVTTRTDCETFTAQRALSENRGPDGGLYLPFQRPVLDQLGPSMNQAVAQVLNLLFQARLTAWDVDFTVGRYPVRLVQLRQKIIMAEAWHNPQWTFSSMVKNLSDLIAGRDQPVTGWTRIAVGIAVLAGMLAELKSEGLQEKVDISLVSGDFFGPISAWYGRSWGLPIGNIICCCNENNSLWDLLTQGQLRTDAVCIPTGIPQADVVVPSQLERLIFGAGGRGETERYLACCRRGGMYCPEEDTLSSLREGLYASVVSSQRMERTIRGAYGTHGYLLSRPSALAYGGLLDYRAKTGAIRPTLVLTGESPMLDGAFVAKALGITEEKLKTL
ncbi:MAG: hypothetical protein Q4F17_02150 [Eubacteriales bacterium]|nr:hypothetical protein [Eubacteriales bacterium]